MADLFGLLDLGRTAIMAQQLGVRVASHNIANVNTEGYTRQRISLAAADPVEIRGHTIGTGVKVEQIEAQRDRMVEAELLRNRSDLGRDDARASILAGLEAVIAPPEGAGIEAAINEFFGAWNTLASDPSSATARAQVLGQGEHLAVRISGQYETLDRRLASVNAEVSAVADEVNSIAQRIAQLNPTIKERELSTDDAGDLRDRRDQLLRELADRIDIVTYEDDEGMVDVYVGGGMALVSADRSATLGVSAGATPETVNVEFAMGNSAAQDLTGRIGGGTIAGLLEGAADFRDFQGRLDQLAHDLATQVNTAHSAGYGLDGVDGRNFFAPPPDAVDPTGAARALALDAAVDGQPDAVAAAQDPLTLPGDNRAALAVVDLEHGFSSDMATMVGDLGQLSRGAASDRDFHEGSLSQTEAFRESVSGVSLDEEMVDLIRYQQAFTAAAKVIQTADQLLETLLSIKRSF